MASPFHNRAVNYCGGIISLSVRARGNQNEERWPPAEMVKKVATAIHVFVVVYSVVSEASGLLPLRKLVPAL